MSNLLPNHLYCSIFLALVQHRLRWQMSPSRRCPFIALDAVFLQSFQRYEERGESYIRRISQYLAHSNTTKKSARSQATRRFDALIESKRINCDNILGCDQRNIQLTI